MAIVEAGEAGGRGFGLTKSTKNVSYPMGVCLHGSRLFSLVDSGMAEDSSVSDVVHELTLYMERINDNMSAGDDDGAWHELQRLTAYLSRELSE